MTKNKNQVLIVGAGLAGSEAAWQLAQNDIPVLLVDMKPDKLTEAHESPQTAELVCSNSLRSNNPLNAVGLLKDEMRRLGSLIIEAAIATRVPAGDALAVERDKFSDYINKKLDAHSLVQRESRYIERLPTEGHTLIATGPLTDHELAAAIESESSSGQLHFYDAIAPIISGESIDRTIIFEASRYDKGDGADYLNIPLNKEEYEAFVAAMLDAEKMPLHSFEKPQYFQGCMPVEVIAERGVESLRFGAMKPVGLTDPRTDRWPYAVMQLRKEDPEGQAWNMVGFQTKMKHPDQKRVFRSLPGLQKAVFLRYGSIHRNTYMDAPELLDSHMRLKSQPHLRFTGQITGVEGYVESAAHGLMTALIMARDLSENPLPFPLPPVQSALGALLAHTRGEHKVAGRPYEPHNINWAMFPPPKERMKKREGKVFRVEQALEYFEKWTQEAALSPAENIIDTEVLRAQLADQKRKRKKS